MPVPTPHSVPLVTTNEFALEVMKHKATMVAQLTKPRGALRLRQHHRWHQEGEELKDVSKGRKYTKHQLATIMGYCGITNPVMCGPNLRNPRWWMIAVPIFGTRWRHGQMGRNPITKRLTLSQSMCCSLQKGHNWSKTKPWWTCCQL